MKRKIFYVIIDSDGPFIMEEKPDPNTEIILKTNDQMEAEITLSNLCEQWEW